MTGKIKYHFFAKPWKYSSTNSWHFVSLPKKMAKEIRAHLQWQEEGWGRLKATAKTGNAQWDTAIWFDSKMNTYLLPLKAGIRKKENLVPGKMVEVIIWV